MRRDAPTTNEDTPSKQSLKSDENKNSGSWDLVASEILADAINSCSKETRQEIAQELESRIS